MPGPGTAEWDGGWSMFTVLLPAEHIPTAESWRLFNLQILEAGEFSHSNIPPAFNRLLKRPQVMQQMP